MYLIVVVSMRSVGFLTVGTASLPSDPALPNETRKILAWVARRELQAN